MLHGEEDDIDTLSESEDSDSSDIFAGSSRSRKDEKPVRSYVEDNRHDERTREFLRHAAEEALEDKPRRKRIKQSIKTFRNTRLHRGDRYHVVEIGLNVTAGIVIGIIMLPLAAIPLIAFGLTSAFTGGAGKGIGSGTTRLRNRNARKRLREKGESDAVQEAEASAALARTRRHFELLMSVKKRCEHHPEKFMRDLYTTGISWDERFNPSSCESINRSARMFFNQAEQEAKKEDRGRGSKGSLTKKDDKQFQKELRKYFRKKKKLEKDSAEGAPGAQAELEQHIANSPKEADYKHRTGQFSAAEIMQRGEMLALKKATFYCAELNCYVEDHRERIESMHQELMANLEQLVPLAMPQTHLSADHNQCGPACSLSEKDRDRLLELFRDETYSYQTSDELIATTTQATRDTMNEALADVTKVLSKNEDVRHLEKTRRQKRFDTVDAVSETGVGSGIGAMVGESAAAAVLSVTSGGIAGGCIGLLFNLIGKRFTVSMPALKEIVYFGQANLEEESDPDKFKSERMEFARRVNEDHLQYALGKLFHYRKKFNGYRNQLQSKYREVVARHRVGSQWDDCGEAYRYALMFLYCAKAHMKYELHLRFVERFTEGHADLIVERTPRRHQVRMKLAAKDIGEWHSFWGS